MLINSFLLLLIELYLVLNIAVAELSHKEDFCFSSGNVSFSFLMFTWKPVIWNHSVLQVLGNRWKWRILSSPIEFNPTLVWLSYFKWSLIILLLRKFNGNYMKENKRLFFLFYFCEQGGCLCRISISRKCSLSPLNLKATLSLCTFFSVRTVICTNSPPRSIIKLTACIKQ